MASDTKVLFYGDLSRFVMREVGGHRLERSTDVFFARNQLAVQGVSRIDSSFVDATTEVIPTRRSHRYRAVTPPVVVVRTRARR
jgi:HK97 family phage major capsid protein